MQLVRARVRNFRSLKDVTVSFGAHTALIGGNGAGKSSILKAIDKFYATSKVLDVDDYFGRDVSVPVEIELTFGGLSPQEIDTFESRVRDGQLVVTRIFDGTSSSGRYFGSVPQNPDFLPIRAHPTAAPKLAAYRQLRAGNPAYMALPAAASAVAAEEAMLAWEAAHPNNLILHPDDGQFFGFQNAGRGALQRHTSFVFIPAVREAAVDAADGKSSAIGKLLELVVRSAILQRQDVVEFQQEMAARYQALVSPENMPELGILADRLTIDLKGLYRDAAVGLAWREVGEIPVPLPVADVSLSDDGFGGPVDRQGHGLQRAFVFTLLQYLAKTAVLPPPAAAVEDDVAEPEAPAPPQAPNLILAIEEPELYQHPTKQRHFTSVLRGLSNGTLPGVESPTQIMFGSHSPMFVALDKADEIRLVRRVDCDEAEFKQCELRALDLGVVADKIGRAWQRPVGTYTAATLTPRLHILGTELAEGFFANGIVLVEGRSDKAALYASAKLFGRSFEEAGIAVLSAEGKGNLDKPYSIFRELGIPVFVLWDCDNGQKEAAANLALLRLVRPDEELQEAAPATFVGENYAHFENTLEAVVRQELTPEIHTACLASECEPFGLTPSNETQKIPEVMHQTLRAAREQGATSATMEALVKAIWRHLTGEEIDADGQVAAAAAA
jgi:hypothetical protein